MIQPEDIFKIGFVKRLHGINGEVTIQFADDIFDRAEAPYLFLNIDGLYVPFFIEEYRFKTEETVIMKFELVNSEEQAQQINGASVYFPYSLVPENMKEPFALCHYDQLTGFKVEDAEGNVLGHILSVDDSSENILLNIRRTSGAEILVPLHPDLVVSCDEKVRILKLDLPDGILTLNE